LDIAILEGKLLPEVISQNASNTNLLKAKQANMEATIQHQEEMIHKLSEENSVFKSKLVSLENLVFRLTGNNQENNDRGPATNPINTPSVTTPISSVKLHNLNTNNSSPINSPSAVKTLLNMNKVFKSKLVSLENLVFRLTRNNQENNDRGPATNSTNTPSVTTPISSVKLHNLNTNNPSPINSPSAVKTPLNMNRNNASPIARNDHGPTINTTNISTGRSSCNSVQLDNLELNDANQSITEIPSAISKTSAKSRENNASLITIENPFPKQNPTQNYYNRDPNKNNIDSANTGKTKKALVACPFLKRRGYCLKGHKCDFLHENVLPGTRGKTSPQKIGVRSLPPNMPQCSNNQFPFPYDPNYFPPIRFPWFYPLSQPFPYPYVPPHMPSLMRPPPLMSIMTKPPVH
jgi:hypothetical protein